MEITKGIKVEEERLREEVGKLEKGQNTPLLKELLAKISKLDDELVRRINEISEKVGSKESVFNISSQKSFLDLLHKREDLRKLLVQKIDDVDKIQWPRQKDSSFLHVLKEGVEEVINLVSGLLEKIVPLPELTKSNQKMTQPLEKPGKGVESILSLVQEISGLTQEMIQKLEEIEEDVGEVRKDMDGMEARIEKLTNLSLKLNQQGRRIYKDSNKIRQAKTAIEPADFLSLADQQSPKSVKVMETLKEEEEIKKVEYTEENGVNTDKAGEPWKFESKPMGVESTDSFGEDMVETDGSNRSDEAAKLKKDKKINQAEERVVEAELGEKEATSDKMTESGARSIVLLSRDRDHCPYSPPSLQSTEVYYVKETETDIIGPYSPPSLQSTEVYYVKETETDIISPHSPQSTERLLTVDRFRVAETMNKAELGKTPDVLEQEVSDEEVEAGKIGALEVEAKEAEIKEVSDNEVEAEKIEAGEVEVEERSDEVLEPPKIEAEGTEAEGASDELVEFMKSEVGGAEVEEATEKAVELSKIEAEEGEVAEAGDEMVEAAKLKKDKKINQAEEGVVEAELGVKEATSDKMIESEAMSIVLLSRDRDHCPYSPHSLQSTEVYYVKETETDIISPHSPHSPPSPPSLQSTEVYDVKETETNIIGSYSPPSLQSTEGLLTVDRFRVAETMNMAELGKIPDALEQEVSDEEVEAGKIEALEIEAKEAEIKEVSDNEAVEAAKVEAGEVEVEERSDEVLEPPKIEAEGTEAEGASDELVEFMKSEV
ncbi:MAG: hypothetical protein AB1797_10375, partial [bacterium]